MVELSDFVPHSPVPPAIVEEYRGRVPDELVQIWEQYGYETFGEGFLRIIDPKQYATEIGHFIGKTQGDGIAIPIMVTGLGDLITWEPSLGVVAILFRAGRTVGLGTKLRTFVMLTLMDGAAHLSRTLNWDLFPRPWTCTATWPMRSRSSSCRCCHWADRRKRRTCTSGRRSRQSKSPSTSRASSDTDHVEPTER